MRPNDLVASDLSAHNQSGYHGLSENQKLSRDGLFLGPHVIGGFFVAAIATYKSGLDEDVVAAVVHTLVDTFCSNESMRDSQYMFDVGRFASASTIPSDTQGTNAGKYTGAQDTTGCGQSIP